MSPQILCLSDQRPHRGYFFTSDLKDQVNFLKNDFSKGNRETRRKSSRYTPSPQWWESERLRHTLANVHCHNDSVRAAPDAHAAVVALWRDVDFIYTKHSTA